MQDFRERSKENQITNLKIISLCPVVKKEKDIKCQPIREKNVSERTDIKRDNFSYGS